MSQIISIHSFRGGTGKSNMTANLAVTIASQGHRVGIVDTDIQSPGIHVIFGFEEDMMKLALNDYLWGRCAIEEAAYNVSNILPDASQGQIYLIPSSIKAGEIARVLREGLDVGLLNDGFRELVQQLNLDYLFIDTHPGLNEETLLSIAISDALVIILRPDRQDFQGTAVTVDVARKLDVPKLLLMINKMPSAFDPATVRQQVEQSYDASVAGIFLENEEMLQLASSGVFCLHYPDHPFTKEVQNVAQQLLA
ncbi:CDP-3,6-dideoxy-D-glycero-L-glycero-4-hexulose-4-reductase [Neosynechococcus sphagnicola sy1]|uniref:CDP-3, 6-dideoxy-D-glycero-L-glycero-4-hexulose-4-reductase n=1 Tax=Neosynechococcus sphagnicola sy1 TaxID=1497020 RepID=A0A098TPD4_9CYAN|nr:MinD/ParA family protein [Neosynechococcus sphagnicola]KGF73752.1 CDP-3,6-dideoxy-D-glycero-L-glycero-4-hexulose-4-reductase [Neosynechococcus sphagnicola sy1]